MEAEAIKLSDGELAQSSQVSDGGTPRPTDAAPRTVGSPPVTSSVQSRQDRQADISGSQGENLALSSIGLRGAGRAGGRAVELSECSCACGAGATCTCGAAGQRTIVYALGKIGYDFGSESRRDSFIQAMPSNAQNPQVPAQLLAYLNDAPYEAESLIWTLNLDATSIYAIRPSGAYSSLVYDRLREWLSEQTSGDVELVSVPGVLAGNVRLMSGQIVPIIDPAVRGMYSWNTVKLVEAALGPVPTEIGPSRDEYSARSAGLSDFLNRVYYDLRNLGLLPEDRALNYSATNAFQVTRVVQAATTEELDLDTIVVRTSPVCRPDSQCYDVELSFFNPNNTNTANRIFRFTVDVSDIVPVTIGEIRTWTRR